MKKLVTHDGTFHTDDIFAGATLALVFKTDFEFIRTRNVEIIATGDIVFDVGEVYDPAHGRFDHHQSNAPAPRANGIPYASFGLVWKAYGQELCGDKKVADLIDERLVQSVDGPDNGIGSINMDNGFYPYGIYDVILSERPTWQEEMTADEAFLNAVEVAKRVLVRAIAQTKSYQDAQVLLQEAYDKAPDKRIVEIGKEYPGWYEFAVEHNEILYVVYKRESDGWSVKASRINPTEFELKKPFPASWAGVKGEELQKITGVPDAVFCHKGRFLAVAQSREGALALAKLALEY